MSDREGSDFGRWRRVTGDGLALAMGQGERVNVEAAVRAMAKRVHGAGAAGRDHLLTRSRVIEVPSDGNLCHWSGEAIVRECRCGVMGPVAAVSIVCKTPGIGGGKSRLRPLLGTEMAAQLSACFIRDVAAALEALPVTLGRRFYALFTPEGSEAALRPLLPPRWTLLPRKGANVGEVLDVSTTNFLADGHDCTIAVNADSPTLPTDFVAQAIAALRAPGDRVVLGPALDGGYYLIGLKRPHPRLFQDIAWSTPEVLARTCERAAEIDLPVTFLPIWYDVDVGEDFARLRAELAGQAPRFAAGGPARHTRALLAAQAAVLPA